MSRLYVLSTKKTASASELLINGLRPYYDVVVIGETTNGKYTGSITLHDADKSYNWAIQPIVLKTANVNYETDFRDGFIPDYLVIDDLFTPLGDIQESMFSAAVSLITGIPVDDLARIPTYENSYPQDNFLGDGESIASPGKQVLILNNFPPQF